MPSDYNAICRDNIRRRGEESRGTKSPSTPMERLSVKTRR